MYVCLQLGAFFPTSLTSLNSHPTVNNNQCFLALLALENVCSNQTDNPNYYLIAFFNLFVDCLLSQKEESVRVVGVQSCCFNVSGISSPRQGWVKSRVCPALEWVRAVQEEPLVFHKEVWPQAGKQQENLDCVHGCKEHLKAEVPS